MGKPHETRGPRVNVADAPVGRDLGEHCDALTQTRIADSEAPDEVSPAFS